MKLDGAIVSLRRRLGAVITDNFFLGASTLGKLHPLARPERHDVEVIRDVPYGEGDEHKLDVYRPLSRVGPLPVVLYVHGGGFRILSKKTHWVMALAFARKGYLVFNIDYRLAPKHPYPAALEDACLAYRWVVENAARFGGDAARLVVAGESAGANLATSLTVAATYARPEPFAKEVFDLGVVPRAVVAACGILQVSDTERFVRRRKVPAYSQDRLAEVGIAYLTGADASAPGGLALADPICILESSAKPERALPAFFASCGTRDILLDDSRRLRAAIERLGGVCEAPIYPGEIHAFQAMIFRPAARKCWRETFAFLDSHLAPKS